MYKRLQSLKNTPLTDFTDRLAAKWQLLTQPSKAVRIRTHQTIEDILRTLVRIPTVTGNYEANHEGLDYIEQFVVRYGMQVKRHEWNGVETLVATTRATKTPTVFLMAHLDVVAAPPELFELREKDSKYYGRGVLDMKGALAAYLSVIQELGEHVKDYDFGLMITTDEEVGGLDGAQNLAEEGYIPKVLVLPDGGLNNWDMELRAKGIWWITLEATGKVAHGSRPWEAVNPIETIMAAWKDIKALFPNPNPNGNSISLTVMHAGQTINQIPATATASIDMRLISFEEQKRIYTEVSKIAEQHNIKLITEVEADPMINDKSSPYLLGYKACTEAVIGRPINWVISNAGNDGRFFAKRGAVCAVGYPIGGNHHGQEEWIDKACLQQMHELFLMYLNKVSKIQ